MNGFIYIIKNQVNGKIYIGQTRTSIEQRWHEHVRHSKYDYCDYVINRAMKKYGVDNFSIELLDTCDANELDNKEIYYISLYNSTDKSIGYNVSVGGKTPKLKEKELDIDEMKRLYEEELYSLQDVAKQMETTVWIVTRDLKQAGVTIRDRHLSARRWDRISPEMIKEALESTPSLRQAAKKVGINYSTFRTACKNNQIEYNSSTSARH